ncbi:MAG: ABC transporter permease [Candidatus Aminicenantes bacterium]
MITNYLKIAFRNMKRHKAYSFINIAGLAIGMAICILILLWVQDELNFDRFHENAENICRVNMNDQNYGVVWPIVSIPVGPALKQEFPEVVDSVRVSDFRGLVTREEKKFDEIGAYVDPSFFEIFSFPFVKGDSKTALLAPSAIVITQEMAEKFFGTEDPLGKNLKLNNTLDLTVTGVIKDMPQNSHIHFDFLLPFEIFEKRDREPTNWGRFQIYTYVMLQDDAPFIEFNEKIAGLLQEHNLREGPKLELEPLTRIHLYGVDGGGDMRYVYVFSIIAVFILVIACINFMNLTTARSSTRAKEVGMRKVTGAQRADLIKQFMGESVLLSLIALTFSVVLVILLLPAFNNLADKQLVLNPQGNWSLLLGFVGIVLFTGLLAGSYPALFLSSFKPVNILSGSLIQTSRRTKKTVFRKALVVIQFSISVFLIISTFVIFKQLHFIQNRNLGYQKEHIITIPLRGNAAQQYEVFKSELSRDSRISHVAATSEVPVLIGYVHIGYDWEGKDPKKESRMNELLVDHDFIETMNMTVVQGRGFSKDYATDASEACIINEAAVKAMDVESPVGKRFSAPAHEGMRDYTIIGVVKDFHFRPFHDEIDPLVMFIAPEKFNFLCIRVRSDISDLPGTLGYIESVWNEFTPNFPFKYNFLDSTFDKLYKSEQKTGSVFGYFTFLAIFISCLGLFGLASQMTEMRTKEIGIRKVFGASVSGITLLLSKDFLKWVIVANVIAWPTAYFAMNKWLQNFAYRTSFGIEIFILSGILALVIALITVSYQSIKAAAADPIDSLRYE